MAILERAAEIDIKQAADLAGVHYTTVYDWRRKFPLTVHKAHSDFQLPPCEDLGNVVY